MEDIPKKKKSQNETAEEKYYKRVRASFAKRRDEIEKKLLFDQDQISC